MEKQDSDVAKRALTEAQERNEDLLKRNEDLLNRNDDLIKKIEESGKVITHLQESLQRCICIFLCFIFSKIVVRFCFLFCQPQSNNSLRSFHKQN